LFYTKNRKLEETEIEHSSGFGEYVLESDGNLYAKYVAHTTSRHLIEKKLYTEACKTLKLGKKEQ